jgi:uncharacterized HAD superfamily protein
MANLKKNNGLEIESFEIYLDKNKFPKAYEAKKQELIKSGLSPKEAEKLIDTTPFELEVYYSPDCGMFAVESEAVESIEIFDPYTGIEMEEMDED